MAYNTSSILVFIRTGIAQSSTAPATHKQQCSMAVSGTPPRASMCCGPLVHAARSCTALRAGRLDATRRNGQRRCGQHLPAAYGTHQRVAGGKRSCSCCVGRLNADVVPVLLLSETAKAMGLPGVSRSVSKDCSAKADWQAPGDGTRCRQWHKVSESAPFHSNWFTDWTQRRAGEDASMQRLRKCSSM